MRSPNKARKQPPGAPFHGHRSWACALWPLAACALVLLGGCGARGFDGHTYHGEGYAFTVPPAPGSWSRLHMPDAALAFDDGASGAMIAVNGRCDRDGEDVPLQSLTQHLFLQFTERETHSAETFAFDGREAMRTDISAKLDGVPRRLVVWVMKKDKCVYDLFFLARPDRFAQGVDTFDAWAKGFSASRDP
jgi:hypothetical protein